MRVYLDRVVPVEKLSIEKKRELIRLERKNVKNIILRENLKLLIVRTEDREETFRYDDCCVEILEGEPTDGLTDGLSLTY